MRSEDVYCPDKFTCLNCTGDVLTTQVKDENDLDIDIQVPYIAFKAPASLQEEEKDSDSTHAEGRGVVSYSDAKYGVLKIDDNILHGDIEITYCKEDNCVMFWRFSSNSNNEFWCAAQKKGLESGDYEWNWIWDRFSEKVIKMDVTSVLCYIEGMMSSSDENLANENTNKKTHLEKIFVGGIHRD